MFARFLYLSLAVLAFSFVPLAISAKSSSQVPEARVMLADLASIMRDSSAGQDIRRQVTSRQRTVQEEFQIKVQELSEKEKTLENERAVLADTIYRERRTVLRVEAEALQKEVRMEIEKLQEAVGSAEQYIRRTLDPILADLMKRYGATMVINSSSVLAQISGTDVTASALRRLDEKLPGLKLPTGPSPRKDKQ